MLLSFLAASLPFLLVRFVYLQRREKSGRWIGCTEDLLAALALCPLSYLVPFVHVYALGDAFLFYHTALRLRPSLWKYFAHPRSFWHSAQEMKVLRVVLLMALTLGIDLVSIFYVTHPPIYFLSALAGALVVGTRKGIVHNCVVLLLKRKWRRHHPNADGKWHQPHNEMAQYLQKEYPLYKFTEAYTGEKLFEVKIAKEENPHIIIVFLESFRARNIGALGAEVAVTPEFDRLAKEGILFSQFYSNGMQTKRSVISGLYGLPSPFEELAGMRFTSSPLVGLPDVVKRRGYQTAYLHNGHLKFDGQLEFFSRHNFDVIHGRNEILERFPEAAGTSWGLYDEYLFAYAAEWLGKAKRPTCLVLYTLSNHHPFMIPSHYNAPAVSEVLDPKEQQYLRTFHYTDHCLGQFAKQLEDLGIAKNTLLFITADHGFHPFPFHHLYEENVHIPLLIYAPGRILEPKMIDQIGSHVDLLPTLMDIMRFDGDNLAIGKSLMRKQAHSAAFFHHCAEEAKVGCRWGKWKYLSTVDGAKEELYDLSVDPLEQKNLSEREEKRLLQKEVMRYWETFSSLYAREAITPPTRAAKDSE